MMKKSSAAEGARGEEPEPARRPNVLCVDDVPSLRNAISWQSAATFAAMLLAFGGVIWFATTVLSFNDDDIEPGMEFGINERWPSYLPLRR